ncbi:type II toxin-antitoxin system prevent-host-death family antitoxin [Tsukamurella sp. NPDC003166]|uniref:type II toxin-antitoxin system Phd/YefM family antitoxin n=1 Tax=Tsukamurella sp. NPDC003166 TaxID=3154444 RepID=UPI0033BDCD4C
MKVINATTASRRFSDLLDAVERGESITVARGGRVIAEISPARQRTGRDLRAALAALPPLDKDFETDIADAIGFLENDAL